MAELITITLSKPQGTSWGLRLQGGTDFATPLCIQKVNGGSIAEQAGLLAGDAIVSINDQETFHLRHKDAQDAIVKAGNSFEMVIQRGTQVWRPQVTPLAEVKTTPQGPVATQTSLAHKHQEFRPIGTGHNTRAAPFAVIGGKKLVNSQYNCPAGIYSDDAIAETLTAQAEVLGQGVIGVNFMKNEKAYEGHKSEVLKMVQDMDSAPRAPSPGIVVVSPTTFGIQEENPVQGQSFKLLERYLGVQGEIDPSFQPKAPTSPSGPMTTIKPGENICYICGSLIVGVFVRIKNRNLHSECFKCATCGTSLKNKGYYHVNDRPYCDAHAQQAARQNPPGPNLEPITVGPGSPLPHGAMTVSQVKSGAPKFKPASPSSPKVQAPTTSALFKPPIGGVKIMPSIYTPSPYKPEPAPVDLVPEPASIPADIPTLQPVSFSAPQAPALAPIPAPFAAPSSPVLAAPVKTVPAPSFSRPAAATSQTFGASAGDINVRAHIPKKGGVSVPSFMSGGIKPASTIPVSPVFELPKPTLLPPGIGPQRGIAQLPGQRPAPRRGRGIINPASGSRVPICATCQRQIRGPFVSALGKTWCPDHFICGTPDCRRQLIDVGFVEEKGGLYCENCYERYLAPTCGKCDKRIKGDCLNAVSKHFHPECFCCAYCGRVFGSGAFYLEDGLPYCETDWNDLFTTKCIGCNFPIEAGDRWVEALNNNYHSQCFKCSVCKSNLEGKSFYAKNGRPFCKAHASR